MFASIFWKPFQLLQQRKAKMMWYGPYHMDYTIWGILYGPYCMGRIIWAIHHIVWIKLFIPHFNNINEKTKNVTEIFVSNRTKGLLKSNLSLSKINILYYFIMNWIKMSFNIFFICSLGYHNLDYGKIESIFGRALFRLTETTQMSWKT